MKQLIAVLALSLAACGGSSDPRVLTDEGSKALSSGKYEDAAQSYQRALELIGSDTKNPEWMRAHLGVIQAHAHLDAGKAKEEFLQLAKANPERVTDKEFSLIGSKLAEANQLKPAIEVVEAGLAANKDSALLKALRDDLGKRAESSG